MIHSQVYWSLAFVLAVFAAGCGGQAKDPNRPGTVPVTGTVTHGGSPVDGATVTFMPQSEGSAGAVGKTDASGKYSLTTFQLGDGAIPGTYQVTVSKVVIEAGISEEESNAYLARGETPPPPTEKNLLPEKYKSPETTDLTAEVKDGAPATFDFQLAD